MPFQRRAERIEPVRRADEIFQRLRRRHVLDAQRNHGKSPIDGALDFAPDLLRAVGIRGEHEHEDARRAQRIDNRFPPIGAGQDIARGDPADRAALLERRQAFLASILTGNASAEQVAAMMPGQDAAHTPATEAYARVDAMQEQLAERARGLATARYNATVQQLRGIGFDPATVVDAYQGMGGPEEPVAEPGNADPRFRELFASWFA